MFKFIREWKQFRAFTNYQNINNEIIIYSESYNFWGHFEKIVKKLYINYNKKIIYLTSDNQDKLLNNPPYEITSFYIGSGIIRTILFLKLKGPLVIMTMPDLEVFHIKRSPEVLHYAYFFHSINSCHMAYRPHAFDFYDSIFTVGPRHDLEIRSLENNNRSPTKKIIQFGYPRLESLIENYQSLILSRTASKPERIKILIAPTWGKNSLIERHGGQFISSLINYGFDVTLRPHPETIKRCPNLIKKISKNYEKNSNFTLQSEVSSSQSLFDAHLMISDYSGAALEFSLATFKPVLFVNVPRKINNIKYYEHKLEPLEVLLREKMGIIINEENLDKISSHIYPLLSDYKIYKENITQLRNQYIYNLGKSSENGVLAIIEILDQKKKLLNK